MAAMPSGYEFYERPGNAQVVLRKVKPSRITALSRNWAAGAWDDPSGYEFNSSASSQWA